MKRQLPDINLLQHNNPMITKSKFIFSIIILFVTISCQNKEKRNQNIYSENRSLTSIQVDTKELDFGNIQIREKRALTFNLKNIGKEPLIIYSVKTSCSCIHENFDKVPIKPGDNATISITMKPDMKGFFHKTIYVNANTTDSPILLSAKGMAIL